MKLILTKYIFADISHTDFDPNYKKYVESMVKIWFLLVWSVAFLVSVFVKLTISKQHYVEIYYIKFHPGCSLNGETIGIKLLRFLSKVWLSPSLFAKNTWSMWNIL